jgi:hypothetical protein
VHQHNLYLWPLPRHPEEHKPRHTPIADRHLPHRIDESVGQTTCPGPRCSLGIAHLGQAKSLHDQLANVLLPARLRPHEGQVARRCRLAPVSTCVGQSEKAPKRDHVEMHGENVHGSSLHAQDARITGRAHDDVKGGLVGGGVAARQLGERVLQPRSDALSSHHRMSWSGRMSPRLGSKARWGSGSQMQNSRLALTGIC